MHGSLRQCTWNCCNRCVCSFLTPVRRECSFSCVCRVACVWTVVNINPGTLHTLFSRIQKWRGTPCQGAIIFLCANVHATGVNITLPFPRLSYVLCFLAHVSPFPRQGKCAIFVSFHLYCAPNPRLVREHNSPILGDLHVNTCTQGMEHAHCEFRQLV